MEPRLKYKSEATVSPGKNVTCSWLVTATVSLAEERNTESFPMAVVRGRGWWATIARNSYIKNASNG